MSPTDQKPLEVALDRSEPRPVDAVALAGLSAAERERAARLRRPEDAARFVTARTVARRLIGERLGIAPVAVDLVVPYPGWKPRVGGSTLELSIAHAGGVVLVALADGVEIGVDVEDGASLTGTLDEALWRTAASPTERDADDPVRRPGDGRPDPAALHAFLCLWTRKEAVLKAVRLGLSVPMAELTIADEASPSVLATPPTLPRPEELQVLDLPAPPGTRIALAAVTRRPVVVRDADSGSILARTGS